MKKFMKVNLTNVSKEEQSELIEYLTKGCWEFIVEYENEE